MRFAAAVGTIDEIDLLPYVIAHLRRIGVSEILVCDYGSTDGSLEYLREAERQGDIWLVHPKPTDDYWLGDTIRVRLAADSGADYVLILDSDEFVLPAGGTLGSMSIGDHDILSIPRYNVVLGSSGPAIALDDPDRLLSDTLLWARPIVDPYHDLAEHPDMPWIRGQLEPKVMVRPSAIVGLRPGYHGILTDPRAKARSAFAHDAIIAHVPFRSFERFERKAANYRATVNAFPDWFQGGQGWQWARWVRLLEEGGMREEYDLQTTGPDALVTLRQSGEVRSAADILGQLIAPLRSEAEYDVAVRRAQPWLSAAAEAMRREGIDADLRLRSARLGHYPSVLMPPGHAVKLCGPWRAGHETFESERRAFATLERDPELPIPRLVAQGELDDEWRYLIRTYAPGTAFIDVRDQMDRADRTALATWLGQFVRRLQAVPLTEAERESGRSAFRGFISDRHARTVSGSTPAGFLPHPLSAELPAWFPPLADLLPEDFPVVPLHADLHNENVLLSRVDGRFFGKSVIDFDSLLLGHPFYQLGPVWLWICFGEAEPMAAFLEASGLDGLAGSDLPRIALAWCLLHAGVAHWGVAVPYIDDVASLDELAQRSFGPPVGAEHEA